jgi:hypothetical protein
MNLFNVTNLPGGVTDLSYKIRDAREQIEQATPNEVKRLTGGERLPHVDPGIQQKEESLDLITRQVLNAQQRGNNADLLRSDTNSTTGLPNPPKNAI